MDWRQQSIATDYDGDAERFEADWQSALTEGRRHALHWQDIANGLTILPELAVAAQDLIERRLGYLPHESVVLPYEPFLRGLLKSHQEGQLTDALFAAQAEHHIRHIRNMDMADNLMLDYDKVLYRRYETYLPHYREAVQERLVRFLAYAPTLPTSLVAELWLRKMMSKDFYHFPDHLTAFDLKAMTLVSYRECLLTQGQPAADASALLGLEPVIKP